MLLLLLLLLLFQQSSWQVVSLDKLAMQKGIFASASVFLQYLLLHCQTWQKSLLVEWVTSDLDRCSHKVFVRHTLGYFSERFILLAWIFIDVASLTPSTALLPAVDKERELILKPTKFGDGFLSICLLSSGHWAVIYEAGEMNVATISPH